MEITLTGQVAAEGALRDILFLYAEMVERYGGFGHGIDTGYFAPLDFVDARLATGERLALDLDLLRNGAAIALLCAIVDWMVEGDAAQPAWPIVEGARVAWLAGVFVDRPEIERAFALAFSGEEGDFRRQLAIVYERDVRGTFRRLAGG